MKLKWLSNTKLDKMFLEHDLGKVRRTSNLRLMPDREHRYGGKSSYGEWCHVVGIFQTMLYLHLKKKDDNRILDVGCGTGILAMASDHFLGSEGEYVGIDVRQDAIEFCRKHYPSPKFSFQLLKTANPMYAPDEQQEFQKWSLPDNSMDAVTALSVWTHFGDKDAAFYFKEIDRVLKPGGIAIITFFLLDDMYYKTLPNRTKDPSQYHMTDQQFCVFDQQCPQSMHRYHPSHVKVPEEAIATTVDGIKEIVRPTRMEWVKTYCGNWKEATGAYFQDILVFQRH